MSGPPHAAGDDKDVLAIFETQRATITALQSEVSQLREVLERWEQALREARTAMKKAYHPDQWADQQDALTDAIAAIDALLGAGLK